MILGKRPTALYGPGHTAFFRSAAAVFLGVAMLFASMLGTPVPADAHRAIVFAWVEGDTVHTESSFGGGRPVHEGTVVVYDAGSGEELLRGTTNNKGEFSFKVPAKTSLRIVMEAGEGHRAEWVVKDDEIEQAASGSGTGSSASESGFGGSPEAEKASVTTTEPADSAAKAAVAEDAVPEGSHLTEERLRAVVEEIVGRKLAPVKKQLAEAQSGGPSLAEVIGGIGYIIGLVGIAAYFSARRKNKGGSGHDS
jgi:nickel transport protein